MNLQELLTKNLFPDFYQEEYPQLVDFVKMYYKYLDTTYSGKFQSPRDIDNSLDSFLIALKGDFAKDVPQFGSLSDREFLAFAKEFYASRGSEDSYRFLFRAMFGKEVEMFYPSSVMLRASDGRWEQDVSIRVTTADDINTIVGKKVVISDNTGKQILVFVKKIKQIGSAWEVGIDRIFTGQINVGDSVTFEGFTGEIISGASYVQIVTAGSGFTLGEFFDVTYSGELLRFKVSKIQAAAIHKAEIIQSEGNYTTDVYVQVRPGVRVAIYTGLVPPVSVAAGDAVVVVRTGSVLRYPGFYSASNGFLSDINKLQDNSYYQAFSYVVKLDEQLDRYRAAVKKLLHPAGMALWAQFDIKNEFQLDVDLVQSLKAISLLFSDYVDAQDQILLGTTKVFLDDVTPQDIVSFSATKAIQESVSVVDSGSINIQVAQDYGDASYFLETGVSSYAQGSGSTSRVW